jgi:large repetitive protein
MPPSMLSRTKLFTLGAIALLLVSTCATSRALTIDWGTEPWAAGSLSNSFDVDPTRPGNDVTVTVSGNTGQLQPELAAPNPMTPAVTAAFQGGLSSPQNSLCIATNFSNQSQGITVTVDFSAQYTQGVNNVSFTIFDVDFANSGGSTYQDQIRSIRAVGIDGSLIAPTITTSVANSLSGTGLNQVVNGIASVSDTGTTSGNGNVTISFGTNAIRSFTFTYGSGSGTVADPTFQHIGMSNVSFTPVPEMNPAFGAAFSCVVASLLVLRHNARHRK